MRPLGFGRICIWALLLGCATRSSSPPPGARASTADTPISTLSGATWLVPAGWRLEQTPETVALSAPDRAVSVTLVETTEADAEKAASAAWQRVQPGFAPVPRTIENPPPRRGWDAVTRIDYVTLSADHQLVKATVQRFGGLSYALLLRGDTGAVARHGGAVAALLDALQPRGMREESFAGRVLPPFDAGRAAELDRFAARALSALEIPGAAVAVIAGGKVVYERSFGVRQLGKPDPVTPETLFMIGSVTKPMTSFLQATLVDAGKFGWDTPVTRVLPDFALGDPATTHALAMWHTTCACTGMPRRDLDNILEFDHVTPEQRLASMRAMKPTTALGEAFQYSNLMVAAGGFAAGHAFAPARTLGDAYDDAMRRNVFEPIGMTATTLDFATAERADHALPHAVSIDGVPHPMPMAIERSVLPIRPAGGVWTNLRDMERYVMTELSKGVAPGGRRVVTEAALLERRKPRARIGAQSSYGLGLDLLRVNGLSVVAHDGGLFGFGATMLMLPDQNAALIVLDNIRNGAGGEHLPFNAVMKRRFLEVLFGGAKDVAGPSVDYYVRAKRTAVAKTLAEIDREPDPAWLKSLSGSYSNPDLGTVSIRDGRLDVGEWQSAVGRRKETDGTVKLVLLDPPFAKGEIIVSRDGAGPTLKIQDDQIEYLFRFLSARPLLDPQAVRRPGDPAAIVAQHHPEP